MSRPEDIPVGVWETACVAHGYPVDIAATWARTVVEKTARAIIAVTADLSDCLSDMTEHYVSLAVCGDCGNWDPETESEVIAARRMIADHRDVNTAHQTKNQED